MTVVSWACALLIISLNVWIVVQNLSFLMTYTTATKIVGGFVIPGFEFADSTHFSVVLCLWLLLLYLAIRGIVPFKRWKDNVVYWLFAKFCPHNYTFDAVELEESTVHEHIELDD